MGVKGYENGFRLTVRPERLNDPFKMTRPTTFFVNSMSDLFHEDLADPFIRQVFDVIRRAPQHRFQVLTKRAERMASFFESYSVPDNAWLGVTVEEKEVLHRLDSLRSINSLIHFASMEPLLEDLGDINLSGIQWIIVGGESGPKARPMQAEWAFNIKKQCEEQKVPFFFKQWGTWGKDGKKRTKKENGRLLSGREWNEMPA